MRGISSATPRRETGPLNVTEEQWARKGLHPDLGAISAEGLLIGYVNHSQNHLLQIGKTAEALP